MSAIAATHRMDFSQADAPANQSPAVPIEDFDYDDRFTPVALRIIPADQVAEGDRDAHEYT